MRSLIGAKAIKEVEETAEVLVAPFLGAFVVKFDIVVVVKLINQLWQCEGVTPTCLIIGGVSYGSGLLSPQYNTPQNYKKNFFYSPNILNLRTLSPFTPALKKNKFGYVNKHTEL